MFTFYSAGPCSDEALSFLWGPEEAFGAGALSRTPWHLTGDMGRLETQRGAPSTPRKVLGDCDNNTG
eukprot:9126766-Pyramimonas_sp.AAC.1